MKWNYKTVSSSWIALRRRNRSDLLVRQGWVGTGHEVLGCGLKEESNGRDVLIGLLFGVRKKPLQGKLL